MPLRGRGAWKNMEIFLGPPPHTHTHTHIHRLSLQSGHCKQDILHHVSVISTKCHYFCKQRAVVLVAKLHKTLVWLQNLQFVSKLFYQNGTIFICMNKGIVERVPNLFIMTHKTKSYHCTLIYQQNCT